MPGKTSIEWTDDSWNPVTGCTKVSPGCDHCYAETFAERWRGTPGHPYEQGFDLKLWPFRLELPLHWKKPRKIFVNSMSDWCHEGIPDEFIIQMFRTMIRADQHIYQLLTKRAPRMVKLVPLLSDLIKDMTGSSTWPSHIWLGVTIESHAQIGRLNHLVQVPSAVRFISYEPALGPLGDISLANIQWLICGAESGHGARTMEDDWARQARDLCERDGVAFFFKQKADKSGHKISLPALDRKVWDESPHRCHCCDVVTAPWNGEQIDEKYWLCFECIK